MVTWEQISSLLQATRSLLHLPCYSVFFASNLFTRLLVHSSTYYVTLSLIQATCSLVYSFTCPLTLLLCLWNKQLVYLSTRSLVHLPCYSVFLHKQLVYLSNLFTRLLVTLPHTPRIGSIFSASLRRIIIFFSAKTWHYSKKVVSLSH